MHALSLTFDVLQDSLTKTVPIWATVLNRAVAQLRSYHDSTGLLQDSSFVNSAYPQSAVSKSEQGNPLDSTLCGGMPGAKARGRYEAYPAKCGSSDQDWDTGLHLPPWVSSNERLQIEAKLDQWVRDLCQVLLHFTSWPSCAVICSHITHPSLVETHELDGSVLMWLSYKHAGPMVQCCFHCLNMLHFPGSQYHPVSILYVRLCGWHALQL